MLDLKLDCDRYTQDKYYGHCMMRDSKLVPNRKSLEAIIKMLNGEMYEDVFMQTVSFFNSENAKKKISTLPLNDLKNVANEIASFTYKKLGS